MEVIASSLSLQAGYERKALREITVVETDTPFSTINTAEQPPDLPQKQVSLSAAALRFNSESQTNPSALSLDESSTYSPEDMISEDAKVRLLRLLMEQFTGRKISTVAMDIHAAEQKAAANVSALQQAREITVLDPGATSETPQFQTRLEVFEFVSEKSSFSAEGSIQLADGREIAIDLATLNESEYTLDISANFQDPLVFQMGLGEVELSDERVSFDLDGNGENENVYFVTGDSSFLALDQNRNGRIDSGVELFGALTGDGYQELAQYDEDGNGFIDEGDSIYDQLVLYNKDANGSDQIVSLGEAGVGAIYLQRVNASSGLEKNGELVGQLRASSIYLMENGGVGKTHQVDLVV